MPQYVIKRILMLVPVLLGIVLATFALLHVAPGDPVLLITGPQASPEIQERIRQELGLDRPLPQQFLTYLGSLATGNLGDSVLMRRPVSDLVKHALPITLRLSVAGVLLSYLLGVPIGVVAALRANSFWDVGGMVLALLLVSFPSFWLGLLLMNLLGLKLHWLPLSGYGTWQHMVMPILTLGLGGAAITARMTRATVLEVLHEDFVRTARAKGLAEKVVIFKHVLRNAALPLITLLGLRLGWVTGGAVAVESVFSLPGMGRLMVDAILARDYPVVQSVLFLIGVSVALGNLIADLMYAVTDPRVTYR